MKTGFTYIMVLCFISLMSCDAFDVLSPKQAETLLSDNLLVGLNYETQGISALETVIDSSNFENFVGVKSEEVIKCTSQNWKLYANLSSNPGNIAEFDISIASATSGELWSERFLAEALTDTLISIELTSIIQSIANQVHENWGSVNNVELTTTITPSVENESYSLQLQQRAIFHLVFLSCQDLPLGSELLDCP